MTKEHPYAAFLHQVSKPARYVGGEYNQSLKDWATVDVSICLAFPDIYDIGMSHMGTKILYSILNKDSAIVAERAFAPWLDMEKELRNRSLPIYSLESKRPLTDFDVVGFSLQYELSYTNVLNMLDLCGIPVRSKDRDDSYPLIIAGGPSVTHPEPIAPFIDAFLIGDAEEKLPEMLKEWKERRSQGESKEDALKALARSGGIYVPALYKRESDERTGLMVVRSPKDETIPYPVERVLLEDIDAYPYPDDSPEPVAEAIFDRMSIEIARGCTEGCRFCQAGMIYRPVRERDPEKIVETLVSSIERGGHSDAGLTSLSTADYSCIAPLIKEVTERLEKKRVSLSVSSLRAYGLGDETLDHLRKNASGGLTFAPEAGTQRMRDVINKNVTEEDIKESAHRIFSKGWKRMKLYFMIGLPTEKDEDVIGIVDTGRQVRHVGLKYHPPKRVEVSVSVSSHVPKPHTPFQWCAMDSMEEIQRKHSLLAERARRYNMRVKWHDHQVSYLEGIIARGDIRVADLIETAWRKGALFDGWDECLKFDAWLESIEEVGLNPEDYLGTLPVDGELPWDHISVGLADGFLKREYRRALRDQLSPPCGKPVWESVHHTNLPDALEEERKLVCYHCGVACDMDGMRTERIEYLTKMGATDRPSPAPPVAEIQKVPFHRKPPKRAEQGEGIRYRLTFTKLQSLRLTGHLDLIRKIPRVFRRAGLPLRYSEGFRPKPQMSFGPSLPLGIWSIQEVADVILLEDIDSQTLLERVNAVSPEGLIFTAARQVTPGESPVAKLSRYGEYLIALPPEVSRETAQERVAIFQQAKTWPMSRISRKSGQELQIDAKEAVVTMDVSSPDTLAGVAEDFQNMGRPSIRVTIRLNGGTYVRPDELIASLLELDELEQPIVVRTALLSGDDEERIPVYDVPAPSIVKENVVSEELVQASGN